MDGRGEGWKGREGEKGGREGREGGLCSSNISLKKPWVSVTVLLLCGALAC